jgi:putative transposase
MFENQNRKADLCVRIMEQILKPESPLKHSKGIEPLQSLPHITKFIPTSSGHGGSVFLKRCQEYSPISESGKSKQTRMIRLVSTRRSVVSRLKTTGSKKNLALSTNERRSAIEPGHPEISVTRQCELLGFAPSTYYYQPREPREDDLLLMQAIDRIYTKSPAFGSRQISAHLPDHGFTACRDKVRRLMRIMGIQAIYPKKNLSKRNHEHKVYPYLLRGLSIGHPDQVWCSDITFIRMKCGYCYLAVVMDWYSRYIISWELSMTMDASFVLRCLDRALETGTPEIFNSDQGSQYTSTAFTDRLKSAGVRISMDGKGRAFDNIMVERLWRTVKYEEVYLNEYTNFFEAYGNLERYIHFYDNERRHSSLKKQTPETIYHRDKKERVESA